MLKGTVVRVEAGEFCGQRLAVSRQGVEVHAMLSGRVVECGQAAFCFRKGFRIGVEAVFVAPERIGRFSTFTRASASGFAPR